MGVRSILLGLFFVCIAATFSAAQPPEDRPKLTAREIEESRTLLASTCEQWAPIVKNLDTADPPDADPIPVDVQRILNKYGDESIPEIGKLFKHENWEVRRQAAAWFGSHHEDLDLAINTLKIAIHDPVWKVRHEALKTIANVADYKGYFCHETVASFNDPHQEVAQQAIRGICVLGYNAIPAKQQLLEQLKLNIPENAYLLHKVFGEFSEQGAEAIPYLVKAIIEDGYATDEAAFALGKVGGKNELLKIYGADDMAQKLYAIKGLGRLPNPSTEIAQIVIKTAKSDDETYRQVAAESLGYLNPATEDVSQALTILLTDQSEYIRRQAAESLGRIQPKFNNAIEPLIKASEDAKEWVRDVASESLAKYEMDPQRKTKVLLEKIVREDNYNYGSDFDEKEAEFYQPLVEIAADKLNDESTRSVAIYALSKFAVKYDSQIESKKNEWVTALKSFLADDEEKVSVRGASAIGLSELDVQGVEVKDALVQCLKNGTPNLLRVSAAECIGDSELESAIPELISALDDDLPKVVEKALYALQRFETRSEKALPKLLELVKSHPEIDVRSLAISVFPRVSQDFSEFFPLVLEILDGDNDSLKTDSANVITTIVKYHEVEKSQFVQPLLKNLKETEAYNKSAFIEALGALGPSAMPAFESFLKIIGNVENDSFLRREAIRAIGRLGEGAKPAELKLVQLLQDDNCSLDSLRALSSLKIGTNHAMLKVNEMLDDLDQRSEAYKIITNYGELAGAVAPKIGDVLLEVESGYDKRQVLAVVEAIGPAAKSTLPQIKKLLADDDTSVSRTARRIALKLAPDDQSIVVEAIGGFDMEYSQQDAVEFLSHFEKDKVNELLNLAINSESEKAKSNAIKLLPRYVEANQMVPIWKAALEDTDPAVQFDAAVKLAETGQVSETILNLILEGMKSDEHSIWDIQNSWKAFGRRGVTALVTKIVDTDFDTETKLKLFNLIDSNDVNGRTQARFLFQRKMMKAKQGTQERLWASLGWARFIDERDELVEPIVLQGLDSNDLPTQWVALTVARRSLSQTNMSDALKKRYQTILFDGDEELAMSMSYDLNFDLFEGSTSRFLALLEKRPEIAFHFLPNDQESLRRVDDKISSRVLEMLTSSETNRSAARNALSHIYFDPTILISLLTDPNADPEVRRAAAEGLLKSDAPLQNEIDKIRTLFETQDEFNRWAALLLEKWGQADEAVAKTLIGLFDLESSFASVDYFQYSSRNLTGNSKTTFIELSKNYLERSENDEYSFHLLRMLATMEAFDQELTKLALSKAIASGGDGYDFIRFLPNKQSNQVFDDYLESAAPSVTAFNLLNAYQFHHSLERNEAALKLLRQGLSEPDDATRMAAAITLPRIDATPNPAAERLLISMIKDDQQRYDASESIMQFRSPSDETIAQMIDMLDDSELAEIAKNYFFDLKKIPSDLQPKLIELLQGRPTWNFAMELIERPGVDQKPYIPTLLKMLNNEETMTRAASIIGMTDDEGNLAAIEILQNKFKDPQKRYTAIAAIGKLGKQAESVVPVLAKAFDSKDTELVLSATRAINDLAEFGKTAAGELIKLTNHVDPKVRESVAMCLRHSPREIAVPSLLKMTNDRDPSTRYQAVTSLGKFTTDVTIVPVLDKMLKNTNRENMRYALVRALGKFGANAKLAIPTLQELHAESDHALKPTIESAIWNIDSELARAMNFAPQDNH